MHLGSLCACAIGNVGQDEGFLSLSRTELFVSKWWNGDVQAAYSAWANKRDAVGCNGWEASDKNVRPPVECEYDNDRYSFAQPEGWRRADVEASTWHEAFSFWYFAGIFHKLGLPKGVFTGF